jgi:hypothetical protein
LRNFATHLLVFTELILFSLQLQERLLVLGLQRLMYPVADGMQ